MPSCTCWASMQYRVSFQSTVQVLDARSQLQAGSGAWLPLRLACHAALQPSVLRICREAAALSRIEKRLEEWRKIRLEAQEGGLGNPALVQLGQRIARLNAAIKYVRSLF